MHLRFVGLILGVALLAGAGCASSGPMVETSYDAEKNQTRYRTADVRLDGLELGSGYGSGPARVNLVAVGRCAGRNCRPDRFALLLLRSAAATSRDVTMYDREFVLNADGKTYRWGDGGAGERNRGTRVGQQILRVTIGPAKLRGIATAEQVDGRVGGKTFRIDRASRRPLRALFDRINRPSSNASDADGTGEQAPRR
jgi:hypothetical protein